MTYRPTVRYDDRYQEYVEQLFRATTLDRNQIMRLALFMLGHTKEGEQLLRAHLKNNTSLPSPPWAITAHGLWLEKTTKTPLEAGTSGGEAEIQNDTEGKDVYDKIQAEGMERQSREVTQSRGEVHQAATRRAGEIDTSGVRINVGGALLLPRRA